VLPKKKKKRPHLNQYSSYLRRHKQEAHARPGIKQDCISKITHANRTGKVAQVLEHLLNKPKPLSSIPPTKKRKKLEQIFVTLGKTNPS
jgi:hypothetical protein